MEALSEILLGFLRTLFDWFGRQVTWRRRRQSAWRRDRLAAYTRFLSAMDLACAAFQEYLPLRNGLHWWNGAQRLKVMRATDLDKRLLHTGQEVCVSLETVRAIGTPAAVRAAEALLQVVADPASRLENDERLVQIDVLAFDARRRDLLHVIRSDVGLEAA